MPSPKYELIEDQIELNKFYNENKNASWLSFDTEFVGEKRYHTLLCLIQVATEKGLYLIDTLNLKNIEPFLSLIRNGNIIKITHAGDNDYRLLYNLYEVLPKNVFDTQLAAGFVGYKYPISFQKLLANELNVRLRKGYTVGDWESRPIQPKYLMYALNDVIHLKGLWDALNTKLTNNERLAWAEYEFAKWEIEETYVKDPNSEAFNSNLMKSLRPREQVFLIRLYEWRRNLAEKRNHSKEMVLPGRTITHIVKTISSGKEAIFHNRRISSKIVDKYSDDFVKLYQKEISEDDKKLLSKLPSEYGENPKEEVTTEMVYLLIKYKCLEHGVSTDLVLPRTILKKLKNSDNAFDPTFFYGWRKKILGDDLINWLENRHHLEIKMNGGKIQMKIK
ncbi:MAG: ribonuclease D, partial [Bacteroidetes bacterium]|nr:ribonuclease D [Bacteroidota bacterium]